MADRATLHAERRTVLGKKVRRLRSQGILPANIYGRNL
ncbi:MAG: 50S ribosomal protein L25, partial [Dehalococcoidia bacterium]|nr:50S ribosomal protein L25 [Dehalococcoidia bacterium]